MKKLIVVLCLIMMCGCVGDTNQPIDPVSPEDPLLYNVSYELTYNPIYEEGDHFSYLILNRDNTFDFSVNACSDLELLSGTYFIEGNSLYLVPNNYACDPNSEEEICDVKGIKFIIENRKKLIIVIGLRCIAEESVFEVIKP